MHLRTLLGASALACIAVGCSSSSSGDNGSPDSTVGDSAVADAHADTRDGGSDTRDAHLDVQETAPDTSPEFDTEPVDVGPGDSSGLFPCGSETCNTLLQFCLVDPGCTVTPAPPADSGSGDTAIDSDGDTIDDTSVDAPPETLVDAPACARHCETYADADASTCLGFPSCACITSAICGGKGSSCDDSSGGVVVSCAP